MVSEKASEKVAAPGRVKWPGAPEGETERPHTLRPWPCEMAGSLSGLSTRHVGARQAAPGDADTQWNALVHVWNIRKSAVLGSTCSLSSLFNVVFTVTAVTDLSTDSYLNPRIMRCGGQVSAWREVAVVRAGRESQWSLQIPQRFP